MNIYAKAPIQAMCKRSQAPVAAAAASTAQSAVQCGWPSHVLPLRSAPSAQQNSILAHSICVSLHDVLANYSAPNGPISIPIEVLNSWLQC